MSDPSHHTTFVPPEISRLAPHFPGYEIQSLIATGGMGAVYQAVQKSLDRQVAIKILPEVFSKDESFCAGFEAEAKAMARLNHPNLIGVYDFGEVDGMLFIIMEYIPGKSLFHSAHGIAIDPKEVIRLVTGICSGLSHAHENGIVHRDIKPANILLTLDAQPKIGDFGLARPVEKKDRDGEEIFGTPHYTAPEVLNSPQSVGFRADLFSVGVILHELLTGRLPADDPRPASLICRCDPRFDAIIRRATHATPEMRYANATEIANDLQAIAASSGGKGGRYSVPAHLQGRRSVPMRQPVRMTRKESDTSPVLWILLLIAALIVLGALWMQKDGESGLPVTPQPPSTSSPEEIPSTSTEAEEEPKPAPNPAPAPNPVPAPNPEPRPAPDPVPAPEPAPNPAPVPDPAPAPEPEPAVPVAPKFDVAGFFEKSRKIMKDKAQPLVVARDKELRRNFSAMEREMRRAVRKLPDAKAQNAASGQLRAFSKECEGNNNRISEKLGKEFSKVSGVTDVHEEYLAKQKELDANLVIEVSRLASVYQQGVQRQVERLLLAKDQAAADLLTDELDLVAQDAKYFPKLMLEGDPSVIEPVKEEKDKKEKDKGENPPDEKIP